MSIKNRYKIVIFNLSNKTHDYQFEIGNSFFEAFPESELEKGNGEVNVSLHKTETHIQLEFDIVVTVELICDRTLDTFDYSIKSKEELLVKYGDEEKEVDENVLIIPRDKQQLDLTHYIYEFIGTSIPMRKLHPRFKDESEDDEMVYTSSKQDESVEEVIDPRWEELKKLNKK